MGSLTSHVARASTRLDPHLELVARAFFAATSKAEELLYARDIDVLFVDAPDDAIPEWGVGGCTYGPHVILVALDPTFALIQETIESTLLHELHHAMRWRGPGCGGNLAQMLVSEGLAQLFEEEVLGEAPFFSRTPYGDGDVERALAALLEEPCRQSTWFFGAEGVTRSFGYAYGYQLCREYSRATGRRASALVNVATRDVLDHAGLLERP